MNGSYIVQNGHRYPIPSASNVGRPPDPFVLPDDHPCHGCPAADLSGGKLFCFLRTCMREDLEPHPNNKIP